MARGRRLCMRRFEQEDTQLFSELEIRSMERGIGPIAVLYFAVKHSFFNI